MTIGVDATTLLTLSFLNILDKTLDSFDMAYMPHSTLIWLFEEKRNTAFHQPSRIRDARRIHDLVATDILARLVPSTAADSDLSAQVGNELAMLIGEAEKAGGGDNTQHIVVRPSPVHRLGSLMAEEADLTEHAAVISSCLSIVERLRQKGQITADEEKRARAYMHLHEKPWPQQPDIQDGAVLYLDGLAVTYFLDLGILEKLEAAGFKAVVPPDVISHAGALISYEAISDEAADAIERIGQAVSTRIECGKIKVGRRIKVADPEKHSISEHSIADAFALVETCDAVIIDDRYINQNANIDEDGAHAAILTTLDLLDILASTGAITPEQDTEHRTRLRRAGYFFVPVRQDELARHLSGSHVAEGKVVETAELKAIRESILHVRMNDCLQLPKEVSWLDSTLKVFALVLKDLWKPDADLPVVMARSDWIIEQIDVQGWVHSLDPDSGDNIVKTGRGAHILRLLTPPTGVPESVKDSYWEWVEDRVLAPVEEQFPELYEWIVERQKKRISEVAADIDLAEGEQSPYVKSALAQAALELMPPSIRKSLLEEREFCEEYGFHAPAVLAFDDSGISIQSSELFDAVRKFFTGEAVIDIRETDGRAWNLKLESKAGELPIVAISSGDRHLVLPDFSALSPDKDVRLRSFDKAVSDVNLSATAVDTWRSILSERPLEDDEVDGFHSDFHLTPVHVSRTIRAEIEKGESRVSSLVPPSRAYYERLVGVYDGNTSITEFVQLCGTCGGALVPY